MYNNESKGFAGNEVRVAQIGCGYWGPNLLRNLIKSDLAKVVAVAEQSQQRRSYIADTFPHVRVVENADVIFSDDTINAVVIATPAASHGQLVSRALESGKHVLVEKPLCFDTDESHALIELACNKNRILAIGHVYLYHPYVRLLRERLISGEFGQLVYLNMSRLNLGIVRSDVNAWWNLAPHDVSMALYLREGMLPESITASGVAHLQTGIEDVVFATLKWQDGVTAHIHVSWMEPEKTRRMTVVASKKMAVFDDTATEPLTVYDKGVDVVPLSGERMDYDDYAGSPIVLRNGAAEKPVIDKVEPLACEIEDFLKSILTGHEPVANGRHASDVTRVLSCGQESINMGGKLVSISAK